MSQEEVEQLRQRLQSGELSGEEARQAIQRLRGQFGDRLGGGAGTQVVGSISSIEESAFTVSTEFDTVEVSVREDTIISVTSVLEPTALIDGTQVMVLSEQVEGSTVARTITIVPAGQGGFGPIRGEFGAGQGGPGTDRRLFGTVESSNDSGFTLETKQGPLPIVMNKESMVVKTSQGAFADLEAGMQVRVIGTTDEDGRIGARSVTLTPEGLESNSGLGGGTRGP